MNKKIAALALALSLTGTSAVFAAPVPQAPATPTQAVLTAASPASNPDATASDPDASVQVTIPEAAGQQVVLNAYDSNGTLIASGLYTADAEEHITLPLPEETARLRAYLTDAKVFKEISFARPTASPVPTPSATVQPTVQPTQTAQPTASATPDPTQTPAQTPSATFPPIYEREVDAVQAFAVVDNVVTAVGETGDTVYRLDLLYQGKQISIEVETDAAIETAPDLNPELAGAPVTTLEQGDVIYFITSLNGKKVRSIHLIYRMQDQNIVTQDTDFGKNFNQMIATGGLVAGQKDWAVAPYGSHLSNKTQYAFGVIQGRNNNDLTLFNKDGKESEAIELSLQNDTIVYVYDTKGKGSLSLGSIGQITKSNIPNVAYDSDGNIIAYSDRYIYHYALARIVNGTVTDIIVYKNYNS